MPENARRMDYPVRDADGLLPGGAPDLEVFQLMERLSDLTQWCALMMRKDSGGVEAARLVQDVRCLIVERLYPRAMAAKRNADRREANRLAAETGTGQSTESLQECVKKALANESCCEHCGAPIAGE